MIRPRERSSILTGYAGMGLLCALIMGCSVKTETLLRSDTGAARSFTEIDLIAPPETQTQRLQLHNALQLALQYKGISVRTEASAVGEIAIASGPSTVGLYAGEAGAPDDSARSIAQTREQRWYDACEASRTKASLAVFDRTSGDLIKRSEVESTSCADKALPIEELAELLAAELVGN